ncbi:Tetratricopeptide repeat-containing protein [Reichenbachiella agariperforans]|uniref:Tetratricopeptide repeat-containing protein n=2 Tax=Reichenbachiella agariperforans TaxID=156994 RepID=A0A1M6TF72_REIAG|nr:Tetratricopeptide repeat-containing protein [Reichenbachiella agariperforans]
MEKPMKTLLCIVLCSLLQTSVNAQQYPLSKHDSAVVIKNQANYEQSLDEKGNFKDASYFLNQIAYVYWEHNHYEEAIKYYHKSLELNRQIENENGIAMLNNNLGMLYSDIEDFSQSRDYFMKTLAARRSKNEKLGMISALINLSVVLNNLKEYDQSVTFLLEALNLAREKNDVDQMKSCYGMLSETYEKAGNAKQSIYYFDLYKTFTQMAQDDKMDKIMEDYSEERLLKQKLEEENRRGQEELAAKQSRIREIEGKRRSLDVKLSQYDSVNAALYENLTQKELQIEVIQKEFTIKELESERAIQEQNLENEKQRRIRDIVILCLMTMIITTIFIARGYRKARKVAGYLKESRRQITDLNENLQVKVDERTKTLRLANEKLKEYIFSNSHVIRRPVANIIGILNLIETRKGNFQESDLELFALLKTSIDELDEVIKASNESLTLNESVTNQIETSEQ